MSAKLSDTKFFKSDKGDLLRVHRQGDGPEHLILLHGFGASLESWDDILSGFDLSRHTLHRLDLKGFGQSLHSSNSEFSIEYQARLISEYVSSQGIHAVTLIGHSYGGGVALALTASGAPQIVNRLILIDCAAFPDEIPFYIRLLQSRLITSLSAALAPLAPTRAMTRYVLKRLFYDSKRIENHHITRYSQLYRTGASLRALHDVAKQIVPRDVTKLISQYRGILAKTLIIWGENDNVLPLSQGRRLAKMIPGAELAVVPECGHMPHEERPNETMTMISTFLSQK